MEPDEFEQWKENLAAAMIDLENYRMPFGKYGPAHYPPRGLLLHQLPAEYLIWFRGQGFPKGRLGELLRMLCELHMTGAEGVLAPLRDKAGTAHPLRHPRRKNFEF